MRDSAVNHTASPAPSCSPSVPATGSPVPCITQVLAPPLSCQSGAKPHPLQVSHQSPPSDPPTGGTHHHGVRPDDEARVLRGLGGGDRAVTSCPQRLTGRDWAPPLLRPRLCPDSAPPRMSRPLTSSARVATSSAFPAAMSRAWSSARGVAPAGGVSSKAEGMTSKATPWEGDSVDCQSLMQGPSHQAALHSSAQSRPVMQPHRERQDLLPPGGRVSAPSVPTHRTRRPRSRSA